MAATLIGAATSLSVRLVTLNSSFKNKEGNPDMSTIFNQEWFDRAFLRELDSNLRIWIDVSNAATLAAQAVKWRTAGERISLEALEGIHAAIVQQDAERAFGLISDAAIERACAG